MRNKGKMTLRAAPKPTLFGHKNIGIPVLNTMVIFEGPEENSFASIVLKCETTSLERLMVFSNLRESDLVIMDEATLYFHIGLFLENAERWAREANKDIVVVESKLPHIVEWFVEHKWQVVLSDSFGTEKGYRGTKVLKEAQKVK